MDFLTTRVYQENYKSDKRIVVNRGGSRCLAPDTLVLMGDYSHKQIKDIQIGDEVITRKGPQRVLGIYPTGEGMKKIHIFANGIKCTENHRIYYRGEWVYSSVARERAMERISSQIHNFKPWQNHCKESSWRENSKTHETRSKSFGISQHIFSYPKKNTTNTSAPYSGRAIYSESREQEPNKSHQSRPERQQGIQSRVGDAPRKHRSYDEGQQADHEQRIKEWKEQNRRRNGSKDPTGIYSSCGNEKNAGRKIWAESSPHKGHCLKENVEDREDRTGDSHYHRKTEAIGETGYSVKKGSGKRNEVSRAGSQIWDFNGKYLLRSISDLEASLIYDSEDDQIYYDIEVENDPCFFVSKDNILVHNSSKTYSLMQVALAFLFDGYISPSMPYVEKGIASVVRKTLPALKASAMRDFEDILYTYNLYDKIEHNKSDHTYAYGSRMVEFFSVDDQQKVRSRKRDILFCIEANELKFQEEFVQMLLRTTYKTYMDFNPDQEDIWIRTELEERRANIKGDVDLIVSTWKDNPFLTDEQLDEIAYLINIDKALYQIFGEGEYAAIRGHIFKNWEYGEYPEDPKNEYLGIDFGFHPDPVSVVKVCKDGSRIWVKELAYERNWTNQDLSAFLKANGLNKIPAIGDSAEPKSIEELRRDGIRISPSVKGRDSIHHGITYLQAHHLIIDPESTNLSKELRSYVWSDDKAHTPVDGAGDHCIDSLRYVAQTKYKKGRKLKILGTA